MQPPDQQSARALRQPNFNEGARSNEQVFNATFVPKLTPNSATDQVLSNEGVASYPNIPNSSVATNQQISNSHSTQGMFNTAATHRVTEPTSNSVLTQPQSNQYVQPPNQQSTRALRQPNFNEGARSNEQVFNATFVPKPAPNSATDQVLSNEGVASYPNIPNSPVATNQQISNSHSTQGMFNTAATHRVTATSNSVPTQPQSNQYQSSVSNSGK